MTKNQKSEFTETLENLEKEVQTLNAKKQVQHKRMIKIEKLNDEKRKKEREALHHEESYAKRENHKTKILAFLSIALVILIWAYPYFKSDPVHAWFCVIAIVCSAGKVFEKMNNLKK